MRDMNLKARIFVFESGGLANRAADGGCQLPETVLAG